MTPLSSPERWVICQILNPDCACSADMGQLGQLLPAEAQLIASVLHQTCIGIGDWPWCDQRAHCFEVAHVSYTAQALLLWQSLKLAINTSHSGGCIERTDQFSRFLTGMHLASERTVMHQRTGVRARCVNRFSLSTNGVGGCCSLSGKLDNAQKQ